MSQFDCSGCYVPRTMSVWLHGRAIGLVLEPPGGGGGGTEGGGGGGPTPKPPKRQVRYYGRVDLDAARVNRDVAVIVEEVIERLTSQVGCEVEVSLEIRARKDDGFDEATIRTISENSHTLDFGSYEFEEE